MQTIALFIDLYFPQLIVNKFSYCLQRKNMLVYTMYNLVLSTYKYALVNTVTCCLSFVICRIIGPICLGPQDSFEQIWQQVRSFFSVLERNG